MNFSLAKKLSPSVLGAGVLLALAGAAQAQSTPDQIPIHLPSGLEAIVYASVPEGFEPTTATDEQLEEYGFPRRPDASNAEMLALWTRVVHTKRVTTDLVEQPGRYHRPVQDKTTQLTKGNVTGTSGNWSAVELKKTNADFTTVVGYFAVPSVASQTAGTANAYSSIWVGLDGDGTSDLIQDGTESDWIGGKAVYDAWVEVLPAAETVLTGLKVAAGDAIFTITQYVVTGGKAVAQFTVADLNTNKNVSTSIAFPANLKFTGTSAEWVVERTEVNGTFENPMPRYGLAFFSSAYAEKGSSSTTYPMNGTATSVATTEYITMHDTPSNTDLSDPVNEGIYSTIFDWLAY